MRIIKTEKRNCDCCGGNDFEEIWSYSIKSKTKTNISSWHVHNVICRNCGFAFVSPCPTQESLNSHYADSYELSINQGPDYSVPNRIKVISRYCRPDKSSSYLEIGSNKCPEFISSLSKIVGSIDTMEINESCVSSYRSLNDIKKTADIVAAYFVLEHVPDPKSFLISCGKLLGNKSVLILEVPNLYIYSKDPAGLLLCEHTNHFSPLTLSKIAMMSGLEMVEVGIKDCSRPFGFVAVFKKAERELARPGRDHHEYLIGKTCMVDGRDVIRILLEKAENIKNKIRHFDSKGKKTIIWAANWNCMKLIDGFELPKTTFIVDSDTRKKGYFPDKEVYQPINVLNDIKEASYLVICAPFYADEIRNWIKDKTGRIFTNADSITLDYY